MPDPRVLFYAPMKPPDHPTPSGDRTIARLLLSALRSAAFEPELASQHRSWQRMPDDQALATSMSIAKAEAERIIADVRAEPPDRKPTAWVTYHSYYKAPDAIGPRVAAALGIPYLIIEASHAAKRRDGPWAQSQAISDSAIRAADAILSFTKRDAQGIAPLIASPAHSHMLAPFIDIADFGAKTVDLERIPRTPIRLVTVAMMRAGAKLRSYEALAAALLQLRDLDWTLDCIGDGAARSEVIAAFDGDFDDRTRWLGRLEQPDVSSQLAQSDLFVWPGFEEAFGMAFLEAQACGTPVVALDVAGVGTVVRDGESGRCVSPPDVNGFSEALRALITDPAQVVALRRSARENVRGNHSLQSAARTLGDAIAFARTNVTNARKQPSPS